MSLVSRYRNLPVKHKLHLVIMATVGAATIVSCGAVLTYVHFVLREAMRNDLTILAEMYGANSTAPLTFGDQKAAAELLSGFRAKRSILSAVLYAQDGTVFASYRRENASGLTPPLVPADITWFEGDRLKLFRRILLDHQHAIKGDRETCLEARMDDYLSKPITSRGLREVLTRWGRQRRNELIAAD